MLYNSNNEKWGELFFGNEKILGQKRGYEP